MATPALIATDKAVDADATSTDVMKRGVGPDVSSDGSARPTAPEGDVRDKLRSVLIPDTATLVADTDENSRATSQVPVYLPKHPFSRKNTWPRILITGAAFPRAQITWLKLYHNSG